MGFKNFMDSKIDTIEMAIAEELRPRVARKLGITLEWDVFVDSFENPQLSSVSGLAAAFCRFYRAIRHASIGNRCGYEPSCSRYAEWCFRQHGFWSGLKLTFSRLKRCKGNSGGLDLPPSR